MNSFPGSLFLFLDGEITNPPLLLQTNGTTDNLCSISELNNTVQCHWPHGGKLC